MDKRVVNEVVVRRRGSRWGGEIDPVGLAHGLDSVPRTRQADRSRVEVCSHASRSMSV